jgi:glutathione S-transferase
MSEEFASLDETEKAAIEAAVNKCRALADQIEGILRNERRDFVDEDSLADLYAALKCAAKILERRQPGSRSWR